MVNGINGNYTYTSGSLDKIFNDPFFIGWDWNLARLNNAHKTNSQSYPPYDILKLSEDEYILSIALAGFSKEDVKITVDNGSLIIINGEILDISDIADAEIIHKGIAARKFTRSFSLGEYMEVSNAELKDGMLRVTVHRIIPEEKKPKQIDIN